MSASVYGVSTHTPNAEKKPWSPPAITDARVVSSTESGGSNIGPEGVPTSSDLGSIYSKAGS